MNEWRNVHVVGVAGVGMSAVAQAAVGCGLRVSGSDRYYDRGEDLPVLAQLAQCGISLYPQDGSGVVSETDGVVVSTAIEADNPDVLAAQKAGIPVIHRSELLAMLVEGKCCLAVAGTSGKSTVTGMAGWILEQTGFNPTVVNGASITNWQSSTCVGNVRIGGDLWVLEADESDRSLLNYSPDHAVITNMSADHFDLDETRLLFRSFRKRIKRSCVGVLDDQPELSSVAPVLRASGSCFVFSGVAFDLPIPGVHNVANALHAAMLCRLIGVSLEQSAQALSRFRGIHRRLEVVGCRSGVTVIDDYAHNPAKIAATIATVQPYAKRLFVIWRPHGYGPLRSMLDALVECFAVLDAHAGHMILLLPVYDVGGTADRTINADVLVQALLAKHVPVQGVPDYAAVRKMLRNLALGKGDVVLVMGARDPGLPSLAQSCLDDVT